MCWAQVKSNVYWNKRKSHAWGYRSMTASEKQLWRRYHNLQWNCIYLPFFGMLLWWVIQNCLGGMQMWFYHILDSSFTLPCCCFQLLTSTIWKKGSAYCCFSRPPHYTEVTQCAWRGNGSTISEVKSYP